MNRLLFGETPSSDAPNDVVKQTSALIDKGRKYQQKGRYEDALACFDKGVNLCRPLSDKSDSVALTLAHALDNKGQALMDLERMADAVACFDEGIEIHEGFVRGDGSRWDAREIAISVMNKGLALMRLHRDDEARVSMEHAIDDFERCGDRDGFARAWLNNAELYIRQKRFTEALPAIDEALAGWEAVAGKKRTSSNADYVYTLYCRADVLLNLRRYQEALEFSDRSLPLQRVIVKRGKDPEELANLIEALEVRGNILTRLGRIKEAESCFREAAKLRGGTDGFGGDAD
jgi:tetratricopeptide (TPR) repeat protein